MAVAPFRKASVFTAVPGTQDFLRGKDPRAVDYIHEAFDGSKFETSEPGSLVVSRIFHPQGAQRSLMHIVFRMSHDFMWRSFLHQGP